ncbi:hypothetical protein H2201_003772 [Coniosporium apollinis]|uniref:Cytokinesis regulator n=1 Tax=Coniosporium apollinis TaxID=61459 RepID=A0ABQ9NXS1_9PEZI|nr:hypothetical protein H2201_003772 [Coniosporium apollinis]
MASQVENWDDDGDFQGDLFSNSISTVQTSLSSRLSVHSESNAGDEDWQVLLTPNDDSATQNAISTAKHAGIPIPAGVPSSALLGGTIQRLGKKKSQQKIDDDWGDELELPAPGGLRLKTPQTPATPAEEDDGFFDDLEGSLGIRFGGTRRENRNRSSSVSAMSPSLNSCLTLESEEDGLDGLVIPTEPLDFNAKLKQLKEAETATPDVSPLPAQKPSPQEPAQASPLQPSPMPEQKKSMGEEDDFFDDLDLGHGEVLDTKKLTLNRNLKVQTSKIQISSPRVTTSLTFTDKPVASRIPRPLGAASRLSKLAPVYEAGATEATKQVRAAPTTTSAQLLKQKRSAPALRSAYNSGPKPPVPFLPAGAATAQSHHITARPAPGHLRRDSDPHRSETPAFRRPLSRLGGAPPETPSRLPRRDIAPVALAQQAASKKVLAAPIARRRRNFGDGSELEVFDDLPTSASKEQQFLKEPKGRGAPKTLRHQPSLGRIGLPERMMTPLPPQTPRSPTKLRPPQNLPRFARDTAASRIARESRLGAQKPPERPPVLPPATNWKAKIAAASPHTSPTAQRTKPKGTGQKPFLIKQMNAPVTKNEKGMTYNPHLHRWEGNESALASFNTTPTTAIALTLPHHHRTTSYGQGHHPHEPSKESAIPHHNPHPLSHQHLTAVLTKQPPAQPPSPPRAPALISGVGTARGVQVEKGMVFDPRRMCWLKLGPGNNPNADALSPSATEDEEDPFAAIEDLKDDDAAPALRAGSSRPGSSLGGVAAAGAGAGEKEKGRDEWLVGEEFDLGPEFIRRQREEEAVWRRRVEGWCGEFREGLGEGWRWSIKAVAGEFEVARRR